MALRDSKNVEDCETGGPATFPVCVTFPLHSSSAGFSQLRGRGHPAAWRGRTGRLVVAARGSEKPDARGIPAGQRPLRGRRGGGGAQPAGNTLDLFALVEFARQTRRIRLAAYGARLERVLGSRPRGFKSPILRRSEAPLAREHTLRVRGFSCPLCEGSRHARPARPAQTQFDNKSARSSPRMERDRYSGYNRSLGGRYTRLRGFIEEHLPSIRRNR